jgi:EAL domain-containing protein (putative c-di-GMP-specific phosphodiesterase class I)
MAVNLSARQFEHQAVADLVARSLRTSGLDPRCLELELTESLALQDADAIRSTLTDLRSLGVRCSIDDFGTGYSGLNYLTRLPIDRLKIDKSFVHEIAQGNHDARIVAAVIALAHNLRLGVIAEGVETREQLDFLCAHGCDEMQGYLFSRPVPAVEFERLLVEEPYLAGAAVGNRGLQAVAVA